MLSFVEQFFDKGDTPAAARTCAVALADLAGSPWFVDADEVANLPLRNVEAVADFVVRLHEELLACGCENCRLLSFRSQSDRILGNDNTQPAFSPRLGQNVGRRRPVA